MIENLEISIPDLSNVSRVIGHLQGNKKGPTIIFIAGIHGNEPAGVYALAKVIEELKEKGLEIEGNFYALAGNLWALERGLRYQKEDLNRLWSKKNILLLEKDALEINNEDRAEQKELYNLIHEIIKKEDGPFYFMDLHTTSSETIPFLTVNDSLLNRKFTEQYPVPIILGIEEYLDGPLLSYINSLGYVAFGFESGQHDDIKSIDNHVAFIYISMVFVGLLNEQEIDYHHYYDLLAKYGIGLHKFYEITERYAIQKNEHFEMNSGFVNFQNVKKDDLLARSNGAKVVAEKDSIIFMPLYQKQGNDGYFLISKIPEFFLRLSSLARKTKVDRLLPALPGIKWDNENKNALLINLRVAKLFKKNLFHLLGYRENLLDENHMKVTNREAASRKAMYKNSKWM